MSDNINADDNSKPRVNVLRLSKFVLESVAMRELPKIMNKPWTREPKVLMKLDIEGVNDCAAFKPLIRNPTIHCGHCINSTSTEPIFSQELKSKLCQICC